jgi:predicted DCC family thiol-disulfide oxidoreductase YuxK
MKEIIVFDGYCNFCSAWVEFLLKRDKQKRYLFTASQTEKGRELLHQLKQLEAETVLLVSGNKIYDKSTAALRVLMGIGGGWKLMGIFLAIPKVIRDPVYIFIASRRYRWWGKRNTCRIPSLEEQERFL